MRRWWHAPDKVTEEVVPVRLESLCAIHATLHQQRYGGRVYRWRNT